MNMVTHTSSFMLMIPTSLDPKLGIIYFQALQKDRSKNKLRRSINQSTVCEFVTRFHIRYACSSDKKYVTEIHIYSWVITLIQFRYFEFHTNFLTRCNLQTMNMTKEMGGKNTTSNKHKIHHDVSNSNGLLHCEPHWSPLYSRLQVYQNGYAGNDWLFLQH